MIALRSLSRAAILLLAGSLAACADQTIQPPIDPPPVDPPPVDPPPPPPPPPAAACPATNTQLNPSLVVNDPTVLARFSFQRVMDQIRATADVAGTQSTRSVFQAWMRTFGATAQSGDCNDATVDPNHFGLRCPRGPEVKLATVDPFAAGSAVTFQPVGLFNRFDLAPANGANCGEYRIVYAMASRSPTIGGRGFIIFEGVLANPTPQLGIGACLRVAQFWQALSADPSPTSRAAKLEQFYFAGNAVPGFPPVVSAQSYGLARGATAAHGAGQIRTNFFVDLVEWQLREFKTRRVCTSSTDASTCRLVIEHVTAKVNPAEELFTGIHTRSASFQSQFVAQLSRLTGTTPTSLSLAPGDMFNEFESVSSTNNVQYTQFTFPTFRSAIQAKLTGLGSPLTVDNILDRATTQTCAGCHQLSNNVDLGRGMRWPASLEFTHIDENRQLSPALLTTFLPRRRVVLEAFINARCTGGPTQKTLDEVDAAVRANQTIGGSTVGAAN